MAGGTPRTQTVSVPLDGGLQQRTHRRRVEAPAALDAVNVRYPKGGGLEKRPGHASFATQMGSAAITAGAGKLIPFRDELLLTDGYTIGSATTVFGSEKFTAKDKVPEAVPSYRDVAASWSSVYALEPDMIYCAGLYLHAWVISLTNGAGDIYSTVQDAATGAETLSCKRITDGTDGYFRPRLVTNGTLMILFFEKGASIYYSKYDAPSGLWSFPAACITDATTVSPGYDVAFGGHLSSDTVYIAYRDNANVTKVRAFTASTMVLVATKASTEAATNSFGFGICATVGETVWVGYVTVSGALTLARCCGFDDALAAQTVVPITLYSSTTTSDASVHVTPCRLTTTTAVMLIQTATQQGCSTMAPVVNTTPAIVGNASAANRRAYWTRPGSRPFVANASPLRCYAWVYTGGARYDAPSAGEQSMQYTFTLVDLGCDDTATGILPPRPVCWEANRFAHADTTAQVGAPSSCVKNGTAWYALAGVVRSASGAVGLARIGADFASTARFASAELGKTLHMAPGWAWDRGRLFEQGYCYWPQKAGNVAFSASSGALVAGKTYRRRFVYEWADNNGFIHRSEPSEYIEFTVTGGNDTATYTVPALCLTAKCDAASAFAPEVAIAVYGTQSTDVDALTYYRVFSITTTPQNDVTQESISIIDKGNATLTTQPQIYNQGGQLANVQPRGYSAIATYRNRIWVAYGNTVNYSKAFVTGEGVSFTDSFELPLEESGNITALWTMDDTLYIATASRIYYLQADGPNDTGQLNDVPTPNRVATELGVVDPRSVVVTALGTLYLSAVGLQLLDRSRQVSAEPFGYAVKDELTSYPTVTSGVIHPSGGYVMFTVTDAAGATGERLVFDYTRGLWSRDTLIGGKVVISSCVQGGVVYLLTSDGVVYNELAADYRDAGAWVSITYDTAWIRPAGFQGYQQVVKVSLQGDRQSSSDWTLTPYYDYVETPGTGITWASDTLDAMPIPQVSFNPPRKRSQAVRFRISDATPSNAGKVAPGKGATFLDLAIQIDPIDTTVPLPAAQKG